MVLQFIDLSGALHLQYSGHYQKHAILEAEELGEPTCKQYKVSYH